jgi:sugar phosphate isomerase/epimerase
MSGFLVCVYEHADDAFLAAIEELGVGLELQSYGLEGVASSETWSARVEKHRDILRRFSGRRALHGPFLGMQVNYRDHLLRDAVQQRLDLTFEVARELSAEALVLHTNWRLDLTALDLNELWLDDNVTFWRHEIDRYEAAGIRVVLENLLEPDPSLMIDLCDRVSSDALRLCLDVGHVNVWSALTPDEWVRRAGDRIAHVHLHDNRGWRDEHLPLGQGTIDFDAFFDALATHAPDATVSLEVEAEPRVKLESLRTAMSRYGG